MSLNLPIGFKKFFSHILISTLAISFTTSCGKNYFQGFALQTGDNALYWTARSYLRNNDYANAITTCQSMSAAYLKENDPATICASAYAGSCGYSLNWFITNLPNIVSNVPSPHLTAPLFLYILQTVQTTTAQQAADCDTAETILAGLGSAANRSQDANMFMALLTIYKIGVVANNVADGLQNGVVTGGFNSCTMSAANNNYIASALWDLNDSLNHLTSTFLTPVQTAVTLLCTTLAGLSTVEDICSAASVSAITATQKKAAGTTLMDGTLFGLQLCGAGVPISNGCLCP